MHHVYTKSLFYSLFLTVVYCADSHLLIRKCCPEMQQLDTSYKTCVNYVSTSNIITKHRKSIVEVKTSGSSDFPWWMDSEVLPLSPDTTKRVQSFLVEQNESKYIEFGVMPSCSFKDYSQLNSKSRYIDLLSNGSLLYHVEDQKHPRNITFSPTSYCVDQVENGTHVYLLCLCLETVCIKKCCGLSQMQTTKEVESELYFECETKSDVMKNYSSRPTFYSNRTSTTEVPSYLLFNNRLRCDDRSYTALFSQSGSQFWMYVNGSVSLKDVNNGIPYSRDHYCWDMTYNERKNSVEEVLIVCIKRKILSGEEIFYVVINFIASIFLVLTLIVFAIAPAARKKNTKIVVCHIVSLLVVYVTFIIVTLHGELSPTACMYIPFVFQFFFLCAFFWLNVMCIDICWMLSHPMKSYFSGGRRAFIYYSLYAWGGPAVICAVTAVMDFVESVPDYFLKPAFGVVNCWFPDDLAFFAYLYGPMAVLLLINLILFVYTAIILRRKTSGFQQSSDSRRHINKNDKKRFFLYLNMFFVMGVTWGIEVILWTFFDEPIYEDVMDVINALRGLLIFIIFCCKREVLKEVKERLYSCGLLPKCWIRERNGNATDSSATNTEHELCKPLQH